MSINLAREYSASRLLVVMGVDGTLLASPISDAACQPDTDNTGAAMQTDAAEQLQRIRDAGIPVVLATRRSESCRSNTLAQLESIGIDPGPGMLFTNGEAKGPALKQMLKASGNSYPLLIIMTDNEQKNLGSVMKEFSTLGTKVHSWRYTRPS